MIKNLKNINLKGLARAMKLNFTMSKDKDYDMGSKDFFEFIIEHGIIPHRKCPPPYSTSGAMLYRRGFNETRIKFIGIVESA